MTRKALWPAILAGWALASALLLLAAAGDIARLHFPDSDDAMRLMQVRDWVAGQSWWDVSQYRLVGSAMHWSRLVDLPIAAVIVLTQPLFGPAGAERAALIVVPLLTLLVVLTLVAHIARRVLDDERARLAILIAPLCVPLVYQLQPMRIDHHGWQVALALAALHCLLGRPNWRRGALMGLSLAALILISLEGLPIAAALCGLAALAWAFDPARRGALLATAWALFAGAALLHLATRGWNYAAPMCDAFTPNWIAVLGTAALGVTLASVTGRRPLAVRLGALTLAGGAAATVLLRLSPECVAGPFGQLDALTRILWYEQVLEGLPLWQQEPAWAATVIGVPLAGLVGAILVLRASTGEDRARWRLLLGAQTAALILALLVVRAGATANAFALPGAAWLLGSLLVRARAVKSLPARIAATAGALLTVSAGLLLFVLAPASNGAAARATEQRYADAGRPSCHDGVQMRDTRALPPGLMFAPLDVSPDLVVGTPHRAIASGHHRNRAAMHDIIAAFTGTPEAARAIVARHRADYLVMCPGFNEPELYRSHAPDSFWARLDRGERFDWLEPIALPDSPVMVWKVRR